MWKCAHCNEVQFATANGDNKIEHLRSIHCITKSGNKVPSNPMDKHIDQAFQYNEPTIRQSEYSVNLITAVHKNPFQDALVYFAVLCQLSLSLVTSTIFIEFLKQLYPAIQKILPSASDTIRKLIIATYTGKKEQKIKELARAKSMIHFSFDLWTSPNHLALLGILAHYVDEYGQNQSVCAFLYMVIWHH